MDLILKKYNADPELKKKVKRLYLTAFPKEERAPYFIIRKKADNGNGELLAVTENGEFAGMVHMVCCKDLAYVFYFAIEDTRRGKGYGSAVLEELKKRYAGKRLFLAREQLDENAQNYAQRVRRHQFYLRSGFTDIPCRIKEASVVYDVMSAGGNIAAAEYDELIRRWAGGFLLKLIDMKMIEDNE